MIDGDDTTLDQNAPETASTEVENSSPPTDDVSSALEQNQEAEEGQTEGDDSSEDEEFEVNGKKYSISKELKPLLMMQQDYTRKTQEVAETRKELEARQAEIAQQAEKVAALNEDRKKLVLLDDYLERQSKVDWRKLWDEDPLETPRKWAEFQHWQGEKAKLSDRIAVTEHEAALNKERETVTRVQEAFNEVKKIPGWTNEVAQKVEKHATSFGLTVPQMDKLVTEYGAAIVKMAHAAYRGSQLIQSKQAAAKAPAAQVEVKPLATVSKGKAPARVGLSDDLSAEEWVKVREKQLKAKG